MDNFIIQNEAVKVKIGKNFDNSISPRTPSAYPQ